MAFRTAVESDVRTALKAVTIYGLFDPLTTELRYIGKTVRSLQRRVVTHRAAVRLRPHLPIYRWWRSLAVGGMEPEADVIEVVPAGDDWVECEQFWISYFRCIGCNLLNLTGGGEGTVGLVFSEAHRQNLRRSHMGQRPTPEHRRKLQIANKEVWSRKPGSRWKPGQLEKTLATKAERRAQGLYKKRAPHSAATRAKISASKRGHKHTEEYKAKLSIIRMGQGRGSRRSPEAKAKMSAAKRGRPLSQEHRAAIGAALRARAAAIKSQPAQN